MKLIFKLIFFFLLLGFLSCKHDNPVPIDYQHEYFPLTKGNYIIYNVRYICFDGCDIEKVWLYYQIKDIVDSTFLDNEGRTSYRIERYRRDSLNIPWINAIPDIVYYATLTSKKVEVVEDGLRFIKLIFPPLLNRKWNGNIYIYPDPNDDKVSWYDGWNYEYTSVGDPLTMGNLSFGSSLTVSQINDTIQNLVNGRFSVEQYAKNVGLVYKKIFRLWTQNFDTSIPWEIRADSGFAMEMKIDTFGKE